MRGTDVLPAMEEMTGADVPETSRTFAWHIVSKPTGPSVRHRVAGRAAAGVKSRRAITLQIPIVGSGPKTRQLRAGHQFPFRHPAGNPPAGPLACVLAALHSVTVVRAADPRPQPAPHHGDRNTVDEGK